MERKEFQNLERAINKTKCKNGGKVCEVCSLWFVVYSWRAGARCTSSL
jgi:hypothetical protein